MKNNFTFYKLIFLFPVLVGTVCLTNAYSQNGWEELAPFTFPRLTVGSCVIGHDIYVFGGWTQPVFPLASSEKYNSGTGESTVLDNMCAGLAFPSVDTMNNKIYVAGGFLNDDACYNQLQQYDPETDSWTLKKEIPSSIGHQVSGVIDDKLYVAGGLHQGDDPQNYKASGSYVYDPVTDEWDSIAPMNSTLLQDKRNSGRWQASSCVFDGKLYVFGGFRISGGTAFNIATPEMYDPDKDVWTDLAEMPLPIAHLVSVVYKDKMYLFGGTTESNYSTGALKSSKCVFEYDPLADSWQEMIPMPFTWTFGDGCKIENYLYLVGGDDDEILGEELGRVWRFNLDSLKVKIMVTGVSLDKDSLELGISDTETLAATIAPADASDPSVSWNSADPGKATVDENGIVTGIATGQTYIYVTTVDGNLQDSCQVTVIPGVGIVSTKTDRITVFPNPTKDLITVQTDLRGNYYVEITAPNGQLICSRESDGTSNQIDLSSIQKGIYFITIRSKDFVAVRKIIKL